ncbi:hypothetical protein E2C01_038625 [Portunus trituberculatus]|uniref:Uncharacterized protein n=1 Tax=Portunus trituberculatus TaxID=210409 RepID=A0A5B7FIH6_PORTR|nr:hypothetical protein [Portunus trituberculatus]
MPAVYHHYQRTITIVTTLPSPYHRHPPTTASTATSALPPLPQSPSLSPLHHHYTPLHDTTTASPSTRPSYRYNLPSLISKA